MDYNMELKVKQVMAKYHKRKGAGIAVCVLAVLYLVYLGIDKMDYRIPLVVGGTAAFFLMFSVYAVYGILILLMVYIMRFAGAAITETLLQECDPYVYEACLYRLTVIFYKDRLACNHAVAQYDQGDFEKAWETLRHMNVSKLKGAFKLNYYIVMSQLYFKRGMGVQVSELENAYRAEIKKKKDQKRFQLLCAGNNYVRAMQNRDYDMAFQFIREQEELGGNISYRSNRVALSMKEAEIYAALGEKESARLKLAYVIKNGGRLFYVEEAKRLIEQLNKTEEIK